jgi:hypothetical protein
VGGEREEIQLLLVGQGGIKLRALDTIIHLREKLTVRALQCMRRREASLPRIRNTEPFFEPFQADPEPLVNPPSEDIRQRGNSVFDAD